MNSSETLEEMVRFGSEGPTLDFKGGQYVKGSYEAFLKDILSMANAHVDGDRLIICGVKHTPDGTRELRGIPPGEMVDAATYQQLVTENIEPELHLEYTPFKIDGITLGVFRLYRCSDRPYAMRKKLGSLERGHLWIRKGTHQMPMVRDDLERIYAARQEASHFSGTVHIGFDTPGDPAALSLAAVVPVLRSDRAAAKIQGILAKRKQIEQGAVRFSSGIVDLARIASFSNPWHDSPYEERSTAQLEVDLREVRRTYEDADEYELYELNSHLLNLAIVNAGNEHLENVRLEITVPASSGLLIADRERSEPMSGFPLSGLVLRHRDDPIRYPDVTRTESGWLVSSDIGDVRHQRRTLAFGVPLRLVLDPDAIGQTLILSWMLHAKNLRRPLTGSLSILVTPPDGRLPR